MLNRNLMEKAAPEYYFRTSGKARKWPENRCNTPSCSPAQCKGPPEREKALAAGGLENAHQAHVTEAKEKQEKKWDCAPHAHAYSVNYRQQKIDRETQLKQR